MKMKKTIAALAIMAGSGIFASSSLADDTVNFGSSKFSQDDVVNALALPELPPGYKTRAIHVRPVAKAISLEITFEKNSYELNAKAVEVLSVLGKALNEKRLQDFTFMVEGHTDASGGENYNLNLSEKRASAVKVFLAKEYHVAENRLKIVGKGESELLTNVNPASATNRRVKIVNMGK
jgi:outer membrane protein OmpA-like peptidoglycan-associated protein